MHLYYSALVFLSIPFYASALYDKSSPVLRVDAKSYNKLIAKSNYTSIVEFYAPWCGHCKNLKSAYEKAAKSLTGFAKVAAVDCDEESNKPFCGSMGVKGFPTLKIVKPSKKKGGSPVVEDYQGARTAKAINEAVVDKIPNHVTRLKDDDLDAWLEKDPSKPKGLIFSEKGTVGLLPKALAIDFLGSIDFGYIKATEKKAREKFGIVKIPAAVLVRPGAETTRFEDDMSKEVLLKFFSQAAPPNPDAGGAGPAAADKKKQSETKKSAAKPSAASETIADESQPTESPDPNVADDTKPVQVPVQPAPSVPSLDTEEALQKACLHTKSGTCILAVLPVQASASPEETGPGEKALASLAEISHKHAQRGAKIFPFYSVPDSNAAGVALLKTFGVEAAPGEARVLAVNAKKGWWSAFPGADLGRQALETWVDNIRFGEIKKEKIPAGTVKEIQEEQARKEEKKAEEPPPASAKVEDEEHDEL